MSITQKVVQLTHTSPIECQLMDRDGTIGGLGSIIRKVGDGFVNLFLRTGESASLTLNENADPSVRTDLSAAIKTILPGRPSAQAALVGYSVDIPFRGGSLETGTWQGLYLCDWASRGARRTFDIVATVIPGTTKRITITPPSRGSHWMRPQVESSSSSSDSSLCCMLVRHTSASAALAEDGENGGKELERVLNVLAPERWNDEFFTHTYEGDDDMPGHCKSTLVGASLVAPVGRGLPAGLGPFLCEHRNCGGWGGGGRRTVSVASVAAGPAGESVRVPGFAGAAYARKAVADAVAAKCAAAGVRTGVVNVCVITPRTAAVVVPSGGAEGMTAEEMRKSLCGVVRPGDVRGVNAGAVETCVAAVLGRSVTLPVADGHLCMAQNQDILLLSTATAAAPQSDTVELYLTVVGSK